MANSRLNAQITIGGTVTSGLRSAIGSTQNSLRALGRTISDVERQQKALGRSVEDAWRNGRAVADLERQYERLGRTIDRARQAQVRLQAHSNAVDANRSRRSELGGKIGGTLAAGAAVALPLGAAIMKSTEFSYQMRLIGNTAEMTQAQVDALGVTVLKTAKDTNQSAENMQKGIGFLIAAGMDVGTATGMMNTIGKSATATGGDIEDLAKAAFTLNDSLKIAPGATMEAAIDTLAKAGKEGNVELKDMAKVLPVIGSGFQSLKMTGREAAATIGAALQIARKGAADPDEAANNMKNFIAKIMSPETLKKASKNFNLDLYKVISDAQKAGKNPFDEAMMAIMKATKGDQKKIGELFTDMQVQNFIRPMIQNWDKYKEIKDKSLKADGTIERDFQTMLGTAKEQINTLTNAFGRLGIAIGSAFEGGSGKTKKTLSVYVDQAAMWVTTHKEVVATAGKVTIGLIALRLATLGVAYAANLANAAWLGLRGVWLRVAASAATTGGVLNTVTVALRATAIAGALAAAPLWVVVAAGAAVVAVGIAIYKYWEPIKAFFVGFGEGLMTGFAPVWEVIKPVALPVFEAIATVVKAIGGLISDLLTPVTASTETLKTFGDVGKAAGQAVAEAFKFALAPILLVIDGIKWIGDNLGTLAGKMSVGVAGANAGMAAGGMEYDAMGNPTGAAAPSIPPLRGAGGSSSATTTNTFNITQQPGQDSRALADEVARQLEQRNAVKQRSSLADKGY